MDWTRGRVIGRGSSPATVSVATSSKSGDVFAVKSAELSSSELLQREAKFLSSLSSPYIIGHRGCEITKLPRDGGGEAVFNLLMEYAPYGTLTDAIRKNGGNLDEDSIVKHTRQILRGLEYLHSKEIVHCDIKGRNVLISENGDAKIADFGCAKRFGPVRTEPVRGTPVYLAPEAARGEHQGFESDVWAVGCTVIEMATGSAPWVGDGSTEPVSVLYRIGYSGELPELPGFLTEQAKDFLRRCLRRDPRERWTASQLLKHQFLHESKSKSGIEERNQDPDSNSSNLNLNSNSPTSVIDHEFWNSMEEASESVEDMERPRSRFGSPRERIGRLGLVRGGPIWEWDDESWITVRNCDGIMGETGRSHEIMMMMINGGVHCGINWGFGKSCEGFEDNSVGISSTNLDFLDRQR